MLRVGMFLALLVWAVGAPWAGAAEVLFVEDSDLDGATTERQADQAVIDHLTTMGHNVTIVDDDAAASSDATGKNLILISSTVSSGKVGNKYNAAPIGLINWEPALYDDLLMANGGGGNTYVTDLNINAVGAAHPLGGGFAEGPVTIYSASSRTVHYDGLTLAPGGTSYGTTAPNDYTALFALDVGDMLTDSSLAPGRRLTGFLFDSSALSLTADGWTLFDAQVNWAVVPEPATLSLLVLGGLALIRRRKT